MSETPPNRKIGLGVIFDTKHAGIVSCAPYYTVILTLALFSRLIHYESLIAHTASVRNEGAIVASWLA